MPSMTLKIGCSLRADGQSEHSDGGEHGERSRRRRTYLNGIRYTVYGTKVAKFLRPPTQAKDVLPQIRRPQSAAAVAYALACAVTTIQQTGGFHREVCQGEVGAGAADGR